ncbi:MAG TPA: T9SS type A sorting domain-containing protein [Chitinophagaceae bacterium]|nr:T9SS type A sorting domain-containing protein [Chitinophagaceae bacterium]
MKRKVIASVLFVSLVAVVSFLVLDKSRTARQETVEALEKIEEKEAAYHYQRWKYEADMIKDPTTGEALFGLRNQEINLARSIPQRSMSSPTSRLTIQNNYIPAGPNNNGGRTRGLAYDIRYNGTTNRVLLAGGVSGGIFRSTDGGVTWTKVTPPNEVHNVSSIAQDPRPGSQDIWYAGGGEYVGSSTDATGAGYLAYGVLKSTDNGATWTRLSLTNITDFNGSPLGAGLPERFDHPFDYVHRISVNPTNGDVYVACHRRVVRSQNGGTSFHTVFGSVVSGFAAGGQGDVVISPTGKVYVAITGAAPDLSLRGIWKSTTGNFNSYTRLAGGQTLGVDSVDGWRGNAYTSTDVGGSPFYDTRRTLLALAPSNENILYVLYENGLTNTSSGRNKEADLFKLDMTSGNNWTNLSANLPDFPGGDHDATDPFTIQGGYDMFITVKPNDPNFVILGGTSLYRSTNGFASTAATSWIGGYGNTLPTLTFYPNSHPDIHNFVFNPSNSNEAISSDDGGIRATTDITAPGSTVAWSHLNNYQTLQYYRVAIDPEAGINNFAGGAQDNGTQFRDKSGISGVAPADSNNHRRLVGGDGASVGISRKNGAVQFLYGGVQFGSVRRGQLQTTFSPTEIRPNGLTPSFSGSTTEFGEFVTNFKLNPDNTEILFYVNFNRLFRTVNAATVTSAQWTELTGVSSAVNPTNGTNIAIRAIAFSRGNYGTSHSMYFGTTDGRIFRLDDPRNAAATTTPVNITPTSLNLSGLNIQDIAVNPNNDNEIIAVVTNYGRTVGANFNNVISIIWTNNAKSASPTWRDAEGNLAGTTTSGYISARSCMIVTKKDASNNPVTEYYVGTAAGLFAVENLGTTLLAGGSPTWQREGATTLNFAVINSLAYRPEDNVMVVGTHGNGLYYAQLGSPNLVTGINNPVLNDKTFITKIYPTVTDDIIEYRVGNKTDVKKVSIQLYNMQGQEIYQSETNYQDGNLHISRFAKGAYVLSIYSDNKKYRHIQKIIR